MLPEAAVLCLVSPAFSLGLVLRVLQAALSSAGNLALLGGIHRPGGLYKTLIWPGLSGIIVPVPGGSIVPAPPGAGLDKCV